MCVAWFAEIKRGPSGLPRPKERRMAHEHHTPRFAQTQEAIIALFCLIDDAYPHLNPRAR
jgi:hypothetical protein